MELVSIQENSDRQQTRAHWPEHEIRFAGELNALCHAKIYLGLDFIGQITNRQPVTAFAPDNVLTYPHLVVTHTVFAGESRQGLRKAGLQLGIYPGITTQRAQALLVLNPLVTAINDILEHFQRQLLAGAFHAVGVAVFQQAAITSI